MAWQYVAAVSSWLGTEAAESLTAAERLVLLLIAERARTDGRHQGEAWESDDWDLAQRAGVKKLREVLERLARRGVECRVQRGTDSRGRPVYAHRGRQTTYRVPDLVMALEITIMVEPTPTDTNGAAAPAPLNGNGAAVPAPSAAVPAPSAAVPAPSAAVPAPSAAVPAPYTYYSSTDTSTKPSSPSPASRQDEPPPADGDESETERLIAEYRQYARIPSALVPKLGRAVSELLRDRFTVDELRQGLVMLHERNGGPGLLPYLVRELVSPPKPRMSSTDQRIADILALGEQANKDALAGIGHVNVFQLAIDATSGAGPDITFGELS